MKTIIAVILTILAVTIFGTATIKTIQFKQNAGGYLERAANANTIELAQQELGRAITYLEENDLTRGYTSILWRTPDEDIGYWYNNLKTAQAELGALPGTSSSLEKSNMLIKLRETLTDEGKNGTKVIIPDGISRYPSNGMWAVLFALASIATIAAIALWQVIFD